MYSKTLSVVFERSRENSSVFEECERMPSFSSNSIDNAESVSRFAGSMEQSRASIDRKMVHSMSADVRSPKMMHPDGQAGGARAALQRSRSLLARSGSPLLKKSPFHKGLVLASSSYGNAESLPFGRSSSGRASVEHQCQPEASCSTQGTPPCPPLSPGDTVLGGIHAQEAILLDASEEATIELPQTRAAVSAAVSEIEQLHATVSAVETSLWNEPKGMSASDAVQMGPDLLARPPAEESNKVYYDC